MTHPSLLLVLGMNTIFFFVNPSPPTPNMNQHVMYLSYGKNMHTCTSIQNTCTCICMYMYITHDCSLYIYIMFMHECMNEERTNREGGNEGGSTIRHTYYWRVGASQPSRTTGTIFLFIYYICLPPSLHSADPAYKLRYFICDTRGPTRNHGKNTT